MTRHPIDQRLDELGLTLPEPSRAAGHYVPALRHGRRLYISGQFPLLDGRLQCRGQVGDAVSLEQAYAAARLAALNAMTHLRQHTQQWQDLAQILTVQAFISSAPGWCEQHRVLDGASDLLHAVLGDQAGHTRSVAGCTQLPFDATVELVVCAALRN